VTIRFVGPQCARRGCARSEFKDGLCPRCWRLARVFGKDPRLFAYEPLGPYQGERDAVELPWEVWEREASARGMTVADLLADPPREGGAGPPP
jgi:hypothetical protein